MSMSRRFDLYTMAAPAGMGEDELKRLMLDEVFPAVPVGELTRAGAITGQQLLMRRDAAQPGPMAWGVWSGLMDHFEPRMEEAFEKLRAAGVAYELAGSHVVVGDDERNTEG
jgi:hypothetical protein